MCNRVVESRKTAENVGKNNVVHVYDVNINHVFKKKLTKIDVTLPVYSVMFIGARDVIDHVIPLFSALLDYFRHDPEIPDCIRSFLNFILKERGEWPVKPISRCESEKGLCVYK